MSQYKDNNYKIVNEIFHKKPLQVDKSAPLPKELKNIRNPKNKISC